MRKQIDEIIDNLNGTCQTLDEACQLILGDGNDMMSLSAEELAYIDGQIFCCEWCGWWCDVSDMCEDDGVHENVCMDCLSDE